ncbi:hypothetical protein PENTCL1PPCAC_10958, partial [Pristionchus entomophagus]
RMVDEKKEEDQPKKVSAEPLEVTATAQPQSPLALAQGSNVRSAEKVGGGRKKQTKGAGGAAGKKKTRSKERSAPKQEKKPAEAVLPDPRLQETRALLAQTCGMGKELAECDKAFDEETKRQGKARQCSDSSTQERESDDNMDKIKKKKKKKEEEAREFFNNEQPGKKQDSPNAKSPEASTPMVEEMDFDLRVMELTNVKKLTIWKLTCVLMSNFFRLPIFLVVAKYYATYGASFIGVCGLMMLTVGIPIVYLELSMGQFTTLPPNTFFARISPIARGVGISMILLRLFAMFCIHVDFRYLFLFFQSLSLVSMREDTRCTTAGMPFCHTDTMCSGPGEEMGMYGACIKSSNKDVPFKDSVLGEVMRIRALQSSPTQLLVDNELAEHNVYVVMTRALMFVAAAVPLIDGAEMFASLSQILLFFSFLTPVVIGFNLKMDDYSFWRAGWNGDMDGFSDPFAWIVAFCLVCSMFNVGEGTWMFVGSWLNFRYTENIRALVYTVFLQLTLMFAMSFVLTAWAVGVVNYQHNGYLEHHEILEILRDRPLEFWLQLPIKVFPDQHPSTMYLAYLLLTLCSFGYVITTGEYLLVSMLRAFPFLVRMDRVKLRGGALLVLTGVASVIVPFLLDAHIFNNAKVHYAYLAMQMIVIFYEFTIFVYIYGIQRVLVNIKTLYRFDDKGMFIFSRATSYLMLCYRYMVSWLVMLGYAYATYYIDANGGSLLSCLFLAVHLAPFIIGIYKIARHSETTHSLVTLFRADARFGPSEVANRKRAATEENKMGAAGLQ